MWLRLTRTVCMARLRSPVMAITGCEGDAGAHRLVPLYACHLRAGLRHTTYHIFFEQLLAQVGGVAGAGGRQG